MNLGQKLIIGTIISKAAKNSAKKENLTNNEKKIKVLGWIKRFINKLF